MNRNKSSGLTPLTDYLYSKASKSRVPLCGTFELSPVCNFSCKMCYVRKTPQEVRAHNRPPVTLDQWLKIAQEAREEGMLYLLLTGGEPFLWPNFWTLYTALIRMGFLISINTNGSLIDDEVIEKLKEMPPARINVTLYGASDETYEALCGVKHVFSNVDRAISKLKEAGILVKLNCSLTPYNAKDLEAMCAYASERDVLIEINTYMFPPLRRDSTMVGNNDRFSSYEAAYYHLKRVLIQNGEAQYINFLKRIQAGIIPPLGLDDTCVDPADGKIKCRAGNASFWITWDGWLTPCGMMPEPKVDIQNLGFEEAWKQLVKSCDNIVQSGTCAKCPNLKMCHSCAAVAITETGTHSGIPQYLCHMVQEMKNIAACQLATGNYAGP